MMKGGHGQTMVCTDHASTVYIYCVCVCVCMYIIQCSSQHTQGKSALQAFCMEIPLMWL